MWLCRSSYQEMYSISPSCIWAGLVTFFGQQDAVEIPLCKFLLTFTLSWNPAQLPCEQTLIVFLDEKRSRGKQPSESSQGHPGTAYSPSIPHMGGPDQDQQSHLPALELTANTWMSKTEIKRTAPLTCILMSNNKHCFKALSFSVVNYTIYTYRYPIEVGTNKPAYQEHYYVLGIVLIST